MLLNKGPAGGQGRSLLMGKVPGCWDVTGKVPGRIYGLANQHRLPCSRAHFGCWDEPEITPVRGYACGHPVSEGGRI